MRKLLCLGFLGLLSCDSYKTVPALICSDSTPCTDPRFPVCDGNVHVCRQCGDNSECKTGICRTDKTDSTTYGTCFPESEVAFVNNTPPCSDVTADSSKTPYCQIAPAILTGAKKLVRVVGSATAYRSIVISTPVDSVTVSGPGRNANPTVRINEAGNSAIVLNPSAGTISLTFDGLEFIGSSKAGISCIASNNGMVSLTLKNVSVHNSGEAGIDSTNCQLTVDASVIGPMNAGGIKLTKTTYAISNSIIHGNTGRGVLIPDDSVGTFAFNTIAKNQLSGATGGIECGAGPSTKAILNSIVWGNSLDNGTQLGNKCTLQSVVTGTDSNAGGLKSNPDFVDMNSDFHLKNTPLNMECCIDKIDSPNTPNKDHDIDNAPRPVNGKWDIGAHEVKP